jgi:hypothetical protein
VVAAAAAAFDDSLLVQSWRRTRLTTWNVCSPEMLIEPCFSAANVNTEDLVVVLYIYVTKSLVFCSRQNLAFRIICRISSFETSFFLFFT